jgi:hypothetical protein
MTKVCQKCQLDEGDVRSGGVKDYVLFNSKETLCRNCAISAGWEKGAVQKCEPPPVGTLVGDDLIGDLDVDFDLIPLGDPFDLFTFSTFDGNDDACFKYTFHTYGQLGINWINLAYTNGV